MRLGSRSIRRFTRVHPSGLPLARSPRMERGPFGFFPGLRTPRSPMTHARAGTALPDTGPGHTLIKSSLQSVSPLLTCDFPRRTITLPVPGHGPVGDVGPLIDGDHGHQPSRAMTRRQTPTAVTAPGAQQRAALRSTNLTTGAVDRLVDRLGRQLPCGLVGVLAAQRLADLGWTPPPVETVLHEASEDRVLADLAAAGSKPACLRHAMRPERPVAALGCPVPTQLPADCGRRPLQPRTDVADRVSAAAQVSDRGALILGQEPGRDRRLDDDHRVIVTGQSEGHPHRPTPQPSPPRPVMD